MLILDDCNKPNCDSCQRRFRKAVHRAVMSAALAGLPGVSMTHAWMEEFAAIVANRLLE